MAFSSCSRSFIWLSDFIVRLYQVSKAICSFYHQDKNQIFVWHIIVIITRRALNRHHLELMLSSYQLGFASRNFLGRQVGLEQSWLAKIIFNRECHRLIQTHHFPLFY
jgi:hypothetical protein